ncbi:BlaI/MecI/CopY family transcriptional regulator [Kitasatospora viridis]|uniref:Putative transcriptional regulator n=1 Tax=Kitasatospora viridis TaxID=281105 RepID=A0A561T6W8_9ACTN|nr:BlaI/MecI/CopY family transcriptional regulator [Kitasatospora viridis]TWF82840.1 putative transcriptional regulator [Kitasatospora viridis]
MAEQRPPSGRRASGELEGSVLAVLWAAPGPLTAAQVNERLPGRLAYTTVVTIMSRLHEKGTLRRERIGRSFAYAPVRDEAAHTARQMHSLLQRGSDREAVLARFVSDLTDEDEELVQRLLAGHPPVPPPVEREDR